MDDQDKYIKGFNHGYELQKHEPELLQLLIKATTVESDYFLGLKDGQKQMEKEAILSKSIFSQPDKSKDTPPIRDKDRDIEPDI